MRDVRGLQSSAHHKPTDSLLWQLRMLKVLAGPASTVIVALERRPDDDAESFFKLATEAGFGIQLLLQKDRVILCELWRHGGDGPVGRAVC